MTIFKTLSTLSLALALFGGAIVLTPSKANAEFSTPQQKRDRDNAKKQNERIKAANEQQERDQKMKADQKKAKAAHDRQNSHNLNDQSRNNRNAQIS
jgi:hypothetical protein